MYLITSNTPASQVKKNNFTGKNIKLVYSKRAKFCHSGMDYVRNWAALKKLLVASKMVL